MRGLRQHPPGELPRPGRAAPVRPVPPWQRPGPGRHRGGTGRRDRSRPAGQRRHRRGERGSARGRAAAAPRLGAAGPARAPHRGGSPGGGARGAAADRRPVRRGRGGRRPAALPALRPGDRPGQAHWRAAAMPQLRGQVPCRALLALRSRPGNRRPRRRRQAALPELPGRRPGEPGGMRRLRAPPHGQRPDPGRAAMPVLPARQDADVLDLRAHRALRDIQGHRPAVVQGMPAAVGAVRRLRADPPGPRRNRRRAAVLDVPAPRPRLLAQLPWLRAAGQAHRRPLRALRTRRAAARPARRCRRRDPPGTSGPLPGSRRYRTPGHGGELACRQRRRPDPAGPGNRDAPHPRPARRAARRQARRAPAQRPGLHRDPAAAR